MIRVFKGELIEGVSLGKGYITYIFRNEISTEDRDRYVMCTGKEEEWYLLKGDRGYIKVLETLEGEEYRKMNGERGIRSTNGVFLLQFERIEN